MKENKLILKTLYNISTVLNSFYIQLEKLNGVDDGLRFHLVEIDKQIVTLEKIINEEK